jgi:hypothetical protein
MRWTKFMIYGYVSYIIFKHVTLTPTKLNILNGPPFNLDKTIHHFTRKFQNFYQLNSKQCKPWSYSIDVPLLTMICTCPINLISCHNQLELLGVTQIYKSNRSCDVRISNIKKRSFCLIKTKDKTDLFVCLLCLFYRIKQVFCNYWISNYCLL